MKTFSKVSIKIAVLFIVLGIVFIIVGFSTGGRWFGYNREDYNLTEVNETFDETIENIDLRIQVGKVTVKQGEEFAVVAENINQDCFFAKVENKTLTIDNTESNEINIFGININPLYFGSGDDFIPNITVYIPKEFVAADLQVKLEAGKISLEGVTANNAKLTIGAGELIATNLVTKNELVLSVAAGSMNLQQIEANNIDVDCNAGQVELSGNIYGDNSISCNVGSVNLDLEGYEEDYYFYDVDQALGSVVINDRKYSRKHSENNAQAQIRLSLECNVGSIEVDTK